jgi:TusA-related sulfurtransferase
MVSIDHFRQELLAQMDRAAKGGLIEVLINSGELYRSLGGYPGSKHGMPFCCDAMQAEMKPGDILLVERTNGSGMTVRYLLPRAN